MRIASSIFKNKKTPGYVQYENVRNNVLKQLGGKGGPYNGRGGLMSDIGSGISNAVSGIASGVSGALKNAGNGIVDLLSNHTNYTPSDQNSSSAPPPQTYPTNFSPPKTSQIKTTPEPNYSIRGVNFSDNDLDEAANIIYGEVSNRTPDKQQFETRNIINTVINRANSDPKNYGGNIIKVLQQPYQYSAYAPAGTITATGTVQSQYQNAKNGKLDSASQKKWQFVRNTLNEMKSGNFKDTTGGDKFYVNSSDGAMWLGSTPKQAQDRANQYEKSKNIKVTKWGTAIGAPNFDLTQR